MVGRLWVVPCGNRAQAWCPESTAPPRHIAMVRTRNGRRADPPARPTRGYPLLTALLLALPGMADATLQAGAATTLRHLLPTSPVPVLVYDNDVLVVENVGGHPTAGLAPVLSPVAPSASTASRYGAIGAQARADTVYPGVATGYCYGNSTATGRFTDTFVVSAPGIAAGTAGSLTLTASVRAELGHEASGSAATADIRGGAAAWIDLVVDNVPRVQDRYTALYTLDVSEGIAPRMTVDVQSIDGDYMLTVPDPTIDGASHLVVQSFAVDLDFAFGSPVPLEARVTLPTFTFGACRRAGDALLSSSIFTLHWDGIRDLRLADGTPVSGATAFGAATGFDYMQAAPVPEPGAGWLMLAGALALPGLLRRRRGSPL
ncbi:MAG: hypothetical protein Fur0014_17640 [Rubrivivax sp.]